MDNLSEMDKFVETYNLPKLNQEKSENMKRPITINEIKAVVKKLPTNNSPGQDRLTSKFYQSFKELTPILLKLFQKIQEEGTLPCYYYEASIILIPKPGRHNKERKLQANITDEHR